MKKNLFTIAAGVAFVSAVSCSVEEKNLAPETDLRVPMEFTAGIGTKTQLNPDHSVVWSEGDVISIFDGEYNNDFTINGEGGAASATFTGKALPDAAAYYALYPHSADAELIDNVISSTLPSEQTVTAEATFATMVNPSVAVAAENSLTFKNIASILQVIVWNLAEGQKVTGISAKADKSLAGAYTVDPSASEPAAVASGSENTGVSLAGEITDLNGDNQYTYSMVVLPGSYNDLTVTVTYSDGSKSTFTASSAVDMPVSDGRTISIDASKAEAPAEKNLYEKFMDGEDIVIAGKTYNKSQFEADEIKTVTNTNNSIYEGSSLLGNGKIIFVDIENQEKPLSIGNAADIVVIGVNPDQKVKVIRTASNLNVTTTDHSRLVLHNLEIDMPNSVNNDGGSINLGFVANSSFGELTFSNCDIKMRDSYALIQINGEGKTIDELNIVDCNIDIPSGSSNRYILTTGTNPCEMISVNITNSVLHCDNGVAATFRLINGNATSSNLTVNEFNFQNNTLVNLAYTHTTAVIVKQIDNVTVTKNLVYFNQSIDAYNSTSSYPNLLRPIDNGGVYPQTANADDNVSYQLPTDTYQRTFKVFSKDNFDLVNGEVVNVFKKLTVDPFEGGDLSTFTPAPEYASYGAQR